MASLHSSELEKLSVAELKACARHHLHIPKVIAGRKATIITHLLQHDSHELRATIREAIQARQSRHADGRKRRHEEDHSPLPARNPPHLADEHDVTHYLDLPTEVEVKDLYRRFFESTSKIAVERVVCAVCARECGRKQDKVDTIHISQIPNSHRLKPEVPHPAHQLYEGLLLAPEGVHVDPSSGRIQANVCSSCRDDLQLQSTAPPQFSLANGLWIGPIPEDIKCLSFLEQVIVAPIRHKCYVFKLRPKCAGNGVDPSTLQRAMRGNVTSYDLNIPGTIHLLSEHDVTEAFTRNCEHGGW